MRTDKQTSLKRSPRGSILIYAYFIMLFMFVMISLAVDFGHLQAIKTELQRCSDATARGCVQNYLTYGGPYAQSYAATLASKNTVDGNSGVSPVVAVTWGWWNYSSGSFVAGSGSPVAVQVVASRTAATGNTVPLTFPLLSGGQITNGSCDIYTTSVAIVSTQTLVNDSAGFSAASPISKSGSAAIAGTHLRLTSSTANQAGTAWTSSALPINSFSTAFSFQLTNPNADGFTFAIQNTSATAVGATGGGLGYSGISKSICVKFDLYNNSGEGTNSTGLFSNGTSPYAPASNLTPSGVNLHSGDVFNVSMTYDGTTLSWTITDATTPSQTATFSQAINIPGTIGGSTAYVGFTGGTGGSTAQQDIITWTYTASGPVMMK